MKNYCTIEDQLKRFVRPGISNNHFSSTKVEAYVQSIKEIVESNPRTDDKCGLFRNAQMYHLIGNKFEHVEILRDVLDLFERSVIPDIDIKRWIMNGAIGNFEISSIRKGYPTLANIFDEAKKRKEIAKSENEYMPINVN